MRTHFKEKNMKMSKRIFIVLLTLAVLATSFALFASADSVPVSGLDCDSLLAYFEEEVIFGYDFGSETDYSESVMLEKPEKITQGFVSDQDAPGGGYLEFNISNTAPRNVKSFYFNWNSEEGIDSFYLDTVLSADKGGTNYPKIRLLVDGETFTKVTEGSTAGVCILTLDYQNGVVTYASGVDGATADVEYALTLGAWYSVSLDYSAEQGSATAVITNVADSSDTVTVSDIYLPFDVVKNVRLGVHKQMSDGIVLKLASLCSASGINRLNVFDRQKGIEDEILSIYAAYTSPDLSIDDKLSVCDAIKKVIGYGFVSENADVNAAISDIQLGSINLYANALADSLDDFGTLDSYYAKRAAVDSGLEYAAILESTDLSPASEEALAVIMGNIDAIREANEYLGQVETDSLAYIAIISELEGVVDTTEDYAVLSGYYDSVAALEVDSTYDGVAEVAHLYEALVGKLEDIKYEAETFIAELDRLADTERDFMDRYYDYLDFKDNVYDNETYPGVTEALAKYNDVVLPDILLNVSYAENFITYVERADFATYISAKEENIRLADANAELCHPDYPGVAEAKVLREEVVEYIAVQKANAGLYIEAVNALDGLSGDALLKGIKEAQTLKKTGEVLGVDGVSEANIKLNQIIAEIEQKERYSKYFISLVDSLDYVYKAEDVYNILVEAKRAEAKADQTYAGVSEASVDLEVAIEAYNEGVYFVNDEFITANVAAIDTVGIGDTANSVADNVIAIIQTVLYEEDEDEDEDEK